MSSDTRNVTTQTTPHFANVLLAVTIEPGEIGHRIKTARERKRWTQLEFAAEANISPSTVQRWERGQLPPVRELMRIAPLLDVEIDELVEPDGDVSADRDAHLREIVREEVGEIRVQMDRIEALLQEPPQSRPAKP